MEIRYDAQAAAAAAEGSFTPAFEPGRYPARATGFGQEDAYGQGGKKVVVVFEVWQEATRGAPTRKVKAHFCLNHPQPQARGLAHIRMRQLGEAALGPIESRGGVTNVAACIGKWVTAEVDQKDGTNRNGEPMKYNVINGFGYFHPLNAPAAPTAGTGAPQPPAPAAPPAYQPVQPTQPTGDYPRPEGTGIGYADTHHAMHGGAPGTAGADQTGYDMGAVPGDGLDADIPF